MAVSKPFFSKREPQSFVNRPSNPVGGFRPAGNAAAEPAASTVHESVPSSMVHGNSAAPAAPAAASASSNTADQGGSKLTVGPNIKLKGVEITDCDTLVVEGTVEATMDSRVIHIAQQGAFHGAAEIDIAEIHGEFAGSLTVREKLVIHSTGRVSGKIRYGKIVIEEGGQLSGEIEVGVGQRTKAVTSSTSAAAKPKTAEATSA